MTVFIDKKYSKQDIMMPYQFTPKHHENHIKQISHAWPQPRLHRPVRHERNRWRNEAWRHH